MKKYIRFADKNNSGFTLLEMAISVVILSIIFAFLLPFYNNYKKARIEEKTKTNLNLAITALENYKLEYGRYPCPASFSAPRNSPNYGAETNCATATVAPGACDAGMNYCVQNSANATLTAAERRIRVGTLPFRALSLQENQSYDGVNSRIVYAVMESLTNIVTYNDGKGGIQITDENAQIVGNALSQNTYKLILLSNGINRVGAFSRDGALVNACGVTYTAQDRLNCDYLNGTVLGSFAISNQSSANTNTQFDDKLIYEATDAKVNSPGWRFGQPAAGENPNDIIVQGRNVRIGDLTPPTDKLSVTGSLYIEDPVNGKVLANQICDTGAASCFDVSQLNHTCPAGEYVIGMASGAPHIKCAPIVFGCTNPNEILIGRDASGNPVCTATVLPPTNPPPGPGIPPPNPVCLPQVQTVNLPCPTTPGVNYQQTSSYSCSLGQWIVTGNNQSTVCCGSTRTANGNCGQYSTPAWASLSWTQTRVGGNCASNASWTPAFHPNPNCTCQANTTVVSEPGCASQPNLIGNRCDTDQYTYSKDAQGRCTVASQTSIIVGSCMPASFTWQTGNTVGSPQANASPGMPFDGSTCVFGSSPAICQKLTGTGYQKYMCFCKKVLQPCTP